MKTFFILMMAAATGVAETWTGTVVDVMCKGKDPAAHPRECIMSCAKSGFGVVLGDGKFMKFDERGNVQTLSQIRKMTKEKDLKATVTGESAGGVIKVEQIEFR